MIRILLLFLLILTPCYAHNYNSYCSTRTPVKSVSGVLMSVSGINFLARQIAQAEISKALKKETNSKFKTKLGSFWGTNIAKGELSSFWAESVNYKDKKFSAQKVSLETICPYNKISYKNDKLNFNTNVVLKFNAELNEKDLSQITKQDVRIEDNKITFNYKISAFGFKISLKIKAGLEVVDNKIQLCNIEIKNKSIDASRYLSTHKLTNFTIDLDENTRSEIIAEHVKIKDSMVYVTGYVIIPQN